MKITNVKAMVAKGLTVGLLAAAVVMAAPAKAEAQVAVGVRFGHVYGPHRPVFLAPAPVYGGFYGRGYYGHPYVEHHEFYGREGRRFFR